MQRPHHQSCSNPMKCIQLDNNDVDGLKQTNKFFVWCPTHSARQITRAVAIKHPRGAFIAASYTPVFFVESMSVFGYFFSIGPNRNDKLRGGDDNSKINLSKEINCSQVKRQQHPLHDKAFSPFPSSFSCNTFNPTKQFSIRQVTHSNFLSLQSLVFLLLQMPSLTYSRPKMDKSRGKGGRLCRVQGSKPGRGGLIRKYAINMNRQVFRERAISMGWKKYR